MVIGREDVAGLCPLCSPRWKAALLPVPICLPHAGQARPRTKLCPCSVWGSQCLIWWHLTGESSPQLVK